MRPLFTIRTLCIWSSLLVLLTLSGCSGNPEEKKATHYKKAMVYLEEKKDKEAIIELRNAIQIDPKYSDARYQLGLLYLKNGETRQAFEELQRVATLDPSNFDAVIKTAEFYLLSQKKEDSRRTINEVLKQAPDNKDALALLANLELVEGKHEAALAAIDKALAAAPGEDRLWGIKGRVLSGKQDFAQAEQALLKAIELDDKKMANHSALAAFYAERKETDKAKRTLEKMAASFPESPYPFLQMASFDLANNDFAAAEKHFTQALNADPKNGQLKISLAEFYAHQGRQEQAEQLFKEAIELGENKEDAQAKLADFYFENGKFDQAKVLMDQILANKEKHAGARLVRAKFMIRDGNHQEALTLVGSMTRDYPRWAELFFVKALAHSNLKEVRLAKESLLEAIRLKPGFGKAHSLLALLLLQEGEFETAKKEAATALKINPRDFQAALSLAKGVLFTKEYETAEKMFTELHAKVPSNVEVLGSLGLTYMAMKQPEKAQQAFDKLLTLQPDNAKAFTFRLQLAQQGGAKQQELITMTENQIGKAPKSGGLQVLLGNLYLSANQPDKALEIYQKAQELDPDNPQPYAMSALILTRQGKTDQAITEYKDLLAKQPKAIGAYMGLGSIYEQTGKRDLAKDAYAKALEIRADFAPAANNLAWMIAESKDGDLGEALRLAMIAKQQQPDNAHIIDTLGWVHYKRGSYSLARSEFMQAVQKQEDMPVLRYHLALALYGEGKKEEAIKELEKTLAQDKPFQEKDEAAALLQTWRNE